MLNKLRDAIDSLNGSKLFRIVFCIALAAAICCMVYYLGKGLGEAIYYLSHPI
jgi:hypothetical protein